MKSLYNNKGHFISEISHMINSCIYLSVKFSTQSMEPGIYYDIYNVRKCIFYEILTFQNDLKCKISKLSRLTLTISSTSPNILFSNVAIYNFIVFFD
jgi:hypothetical protein